MNARSVLIGVCGVVCLGTITGVVIQGSQISDLRAEQRRLTQLETSYDASGTAPAETISRAGPRTDYSPSPELLQLRDQVNRLMARKRELASVTNENERLRAQLAARATNAVQLPPGYMRRSQAQMAGYNTPVAAIESFLWAAQNRDLVNLLQAMTPESSQRLQQQFQQREQAAEKFIGEMSTLPGMRILEQQPQEDGSISLKVEIIPGIPGIENIRLRQIAGQWKIDFKGL